MHFSVVMHIGFQELDRKRVKSLDNTGKLYTPWSIKKRATFIFSITLANIDGFSQFFHYYIQEGTVE